VDGDFGPDLGLLNVADACVSNAMSC